MRVIVCISDNGRAWRWAGIEAPQADNKSKIKKLKMMKIEKADKSSFAGTAIDSSTNDDVQHVSQPIAKPDVVRSGSVGMVDNENHLYELMQQIEKALQDVIVVHGQIKNVSKIGNSVSIFFNDGTIYKQPLVSKETSVATMDNK